MDELLSRGKRMRMINRSGRANVPEGVESVGGDATDPAFAREVSVGASVVYFALNPPYDRWPELFPSLQAGVMEGAASAGAKLVAMENLYMYAGDRAVVPRAPQCTEMIGRDFLDRRRSVPPTPKAVRGRAIWGSRVDACSKIDVCLCRSWPPSSTFPRLGPGSSPAPA